MDAALHAHLGGARLPRLLRAVGDLVQGERVGVRVGAALGEGAEPAAGVADVGEVDVPGDDVGDVVTDGVAAHPVGQTGEGLQGVAVGVQERERLGVAQPGGVPFGAAQGGGDLGVRPTGHRALAVDDGGEFVPVPVDRVEVAAPILGTALGVDVGVQVGAARGDHDRLGFLPGAAHQGRVLAGQAGLGVHQGVDVGAHPWVDPGFAGPDVLGVDGEALAQREALGLGAGGEVVDLGPGAFGVDVVGGERGDPAPVVDARADHQRVLVHAAALRADEVGRRLDVRLGSHDQSGDGDGGGHLLALDVGPVHHRGVRLGAEVLHDDLLETAVAAGDPAHREDRVRPVGERLADAQQQAGGEGDAGTTGVLQGAQPDGRVLVGAAVVGLALLLEQTPGGGLQHHAHRGRDRLEALEVRPGQHPGVEVR